MAEQHCSIRQAAQRLGCSRATLQRLLSSEANLARAVVGRGPRGSTLVSMALLEPAWRALQGPSGEGLSHRAQYDLQRRRRLWFDLCGERAELAELAASLVEASELEELRQVERAVLTAAAASWTDRIAQELPALEPAAAPMHLERSVHAQLTELARRGARAADPPPPPPSIQFPDPPPALWELKAALEAVRADRAHLELRHRRGELVDARDATDRFSAQGREKRDAWQRVARNLGLRARQLRTCESVRTAALQELSAAGLA